MDYNRFKLKTGVTGADVTKCLHEKFPGFTKIQQSMISNPSKYGVRLITEAEQELIRVFDAKEEEKEQRPKRTKISVRVDPELYTNFKEQISVSGYKTVQEAFETMIKEPKQERSDFKAGYDEGYKSGRAELKNCINELCLKCGKYEIDFLGACDGCKWYGLKYE